MIKKMPLAVRRMTLLMTGMAFAESEAPVNDQRRRMIRDCVGTKKEARDNIQGARSS